MTYCVLDCSVALAWVMPGEATGIINALQDRIMQGGALIPSLFPLEFANAVLMGVRRGKLTPAERERTMGFMAALPLELELAHPLASLGATLDLATTHRLSAYDAAYLDLALRRRLPLASLDRALRQAADACGVTRLGV